MHTTVKDYYSGYEGEPEIRFVRRTTGEELVFSMWEGDFEAIMDAIQPTEEGWVSLAKFYHLHEGWYDVEDWPIADPDEVYAQLGSIDGEVLAQGVRPIWDDLLGFLAGGIKQGDPLAIHYL